MPSAQAWPPTGAWSLRAACQDEDPELFFPSTPGNKTAKARRVCAGCVVRDECLEYAVPLPKLKGIWAGTNEKQRRLIRTIRENRLVSLPEQLPEEVDV